MEDSCVKCSEILCLAFQANASSRWVEKVFSLSDLKWLMKFFIVRHKTRHFFSHSYRLDYVSSSNEVNVIFHTDFSEAMTGFEIVWRAVDVTSCISGKTIIAGPGGNGFSIHESTIHTPNFPYFNLPQLDCVYTIVAPGSLKHSLFLYTGSRNLKKHLCHWAIWRISTA